VSFRAPFCGIAAIIIAGLFSGLLPTGARAFSAPAVFAKAAISGGTEGRFFTGSPADGYGCDVCHSGGQNMPLYVTGLPARGYAPGMKYELRMYWPEFTARERALIAVNPDPDKAPTMSIVAELVSETGKGSGKLSIKAPEMYTPNERCVRPENKAGQSMWIVKAKSKPLGEILLDCNSETYNDRCLVSLISCGASELRMTWTAPTEWQGTIWLNAGFVTTDSLDSQPTHDGVYNLSVPLPPAASTSAGYLETLNGSCNVAAAGVGHPLRPGLALAGALGLAIYWRRRARSRLRALDEERS
jgi:hypothetical protein